MEHTFNMEPYPYRSFWTSLNPIPETPTTPDLPPPEVLDPPKTVGPLVLLLPPNGIVGFDDPPRPLMSREDLIGIGLITVGILSMAFVVVTFSR
jgi:hypothetical protein